MTPWELAGVHVTGFPHEGKSLTPQLPRSTTETRPARVARSPEPTWGPSHTLGTLPSPPTGSGNCSMKGQPQDAQLVLQKKERKHKCLRNFYSQTM